MATTPGTFEGFGPDLIDFYDGLAADNSKAFWADHKAVYDEQVGGPAKALAVALEGEFGPVKVFRAHRDVRFSKDKTPYKTNVSIAGGRDGAGVCYFSVSPGGVDLAGGLYTPSRDQLQRFRELQDDERASRSMDALLAELDGAGFSMMEEGALKTAPRGWGKDHPRVDVLRRKHLAIGQDREPGPWLGSAACLDEVRAAWRTVGRWNAWLEERVGIPLEAARARGTDASR